VSTYPRANPNALGASPTGSMRNAMRSSATIAALACCAAPAVATVRVCKDLTCQVGYLVVPKTKHALTIADANDTVTAAECLARPEYVNATDGSIFWEDCACACSGPARVALVALLAVMAFYAVVVFIFVTGTKILRAGPAAEYATLKAAGKVREDSEEIGGESARAWMTKTEDTIRADVRLIDWR
jgi:hypothetical protein